MHTADRKNFAAPMLLTVCPVDAHILLEAKES